MELKKVEINELKTLNGTFKSKLEEAQEMLKSNGDLITYLNKQLNEKPGLSTTLGGSTNAATMQAPGSFTKRLEKPPIINPPTTSVAQNTFKPSFTSIEKLNSVSNTGAGSNTLQRSNSRQSFDRQASPQNSHRSFTSSHLASTQQSIKPVGQSNPLTSSSLA